MILAASVGLIVVVLAYVLLIRHQDLPYVEPHSPTAHLDERKAAIYENIRDANFEFLMGKLSQEDYQQTKADLQQELNEVNGEIRKVTQSRPAPSAAKPAPVAAPQSGASPAQAAPSVSAKGTARFVCGNCGASFPAPMKFCGECGHKMGDARG